MATSSAVTANDLGVAATAATAATTSQKNEAGAADRFLKLLVAQMQNQDPLKPMDNAQVTSQMAQIQTVSGIEKLNKSIESMSASFATMQAMQSLQGAAIVGRGVALEGSGLELDADGFTSGSFDLAGPAKTVTVEIVSPKRQVVGKVELGPLGAGRHSFGWELPDSVKAEDVATFRVVAKAGGANVAATPYTHDRVLSAITDGNTLMLQLLHGGTVPYSQVKSFH